MSIRNDRKRFLMMGAMICLPIQLAQAAADYYESFDNVGPVANGEDGPSGLIAEGWIFRNQSEPEGDRSWFQGFNNFFPPQAGSGYLAVDSLSTDFFGGTVSNWAILPAIPGQEAGDIMTFYIRALESSNVDIMQVRYSPSGGTSTGTSSDDVGDFTEVLLDLNPVPLTGWTIQSIELPGSGRIAFRYYIESACNFGCFGSYVGIDELTINQTAPPGPPLPSAGETVHWTLDLSPVVIDSDIAIVEGGTLIIDPGVEVVVQDPAVMYILGVVQVNPGAMITIERPGRIHIDGGTLNMAGSSTAPVMLLGGASPLSYAVTQVGGSFYLNFVDTDVLVGQGDIFDVRPAFISVEESLWHGTASGLTTSYATVRVGGSTFTDGAALVVNDTYLWIDQTVFETGLLISERLKAGQPLYLNNLTGRDNPSTGPFILIGFDHFFGPDNTIVNNGWPVQLALDDGLPGGGGIAPGSVLPLTGNINNEILAGFGEAQGKITYADIGLPYRVQGDPFEGHELGGQLLIEPGVTVLLEPAATLFAVGGARIIAEGLPDRPIIFDRYNPEAPWENINFFINSTRPKMEYCTVRGSELGGVVSDETVVRIESCILEDNLIGSKSANFGSVEARKTRFLNNGIGFQASGIGPIGVGHGDLSGETNPNSFEGNGEGIDITNTTSVVTAEFNWWGDPSGPMHQDNPGGTGDSADAAADVIPFLTAPPDYSDTPPVVRLIEPYFLLDEGQKVILSWSATDDGSIVSQQLLYSPHSENPDLSVLIDEIPADQRSIEIVVPQSPPSSNDDPPVIRILAVDDAGQEGWDEGMFFTPFIDFEETVVPDPIVGEFRPGDVVDICYTFSGGLGGTVDAFLFLDADDQNFSLGGSTTAVECLSLGLTVPPVSTDTARVGIRFNSGAGGRNRWEFTNNFSIRPDPGIGDAPPTVIMTSPADGSVFAGGGIVHIAWVSGDDEAVRSHDIQASYDSGRTWHFIARNLPAEQSSFDWQLPPSTGIEDARIRVIVKDLRFQNSSDGAQHSIEIVPFDCEGDSNHDGTVDPLDSGYVLARLGCPVDSGDPACDAADANGDGIVDPLDVGFVLSRFGECP